MLETKIHYGDNRVTMPAIPSEIAQTCVTSPPYWKLRRYGDDEREIGQEKTPDEFVATMVEVFREVRRILKPDGTLWLNLGDSYAGSWRAQSREENDPRNGAGISGNQIKAHPKKTHTGSLKDIPGLKPKDLVGIPWRVAFALQADGWYLRSEIIWHKPNPMPESVTDRPTKSHEHIFLFAKQEEYFYDFDAIKEPAIAGDNGSSFVSEYDIATKPGLGRKPRNRSGEYQKESGRNDGDRHLSGGFPSKGYRNKRDVWTVPTDPYSGAHFAVFPPALITPCVLAGSRPRDIVFDPFSGSGTTGQVAHDLGRSFHGCELYEKFGELIQARTAQHGFVFND